MNTQPENQNIAEEETPPTYDALESNIQYDTQIDDPHADNVLGQLHPQTTQISSRNNAGRFRSLFRFSIFNQTNRPGPKARRNSFGDLPPSYSTIEMLDLPPAYKTLYPTKKSFFRNMLASLYRGVVLILSTIITGIKKIYDLFTLKNLRKIPYDLIILILLVIFNIKSFWWIKILKNELNEDFDDNKWHVTNYSSMGASVATIVLSLITRYKCYQDIGKVYCLLIFLIIFYFSCTFDFIYWYFDVIERLYNENKF